MQYFSRLLLTASFGAIFYSSNNYNAEGLGYAPPPALNELEAQYQALYGPETPYEHTIFSYLASFASGQQLSHKEVSNFWFKECYHS